MKRNSEQQNEIVKEALERFETASDGWSDIYEQSVADVSFIDDDEGQWEDSDGANALSQSQSRRGRR